MRRQTDGLGLRSLKLLQALCQQTCAMFEWCASGKLWPAQSMPSMASSCCWAEACAMDARTHIQEVIIDE